MFGILQWMRNIASAQVPDTSIIPDIMRLNNLATV